METNQTRSFKLKFMVLVRLLAETTMLVILSILPLVLWSMNKLWILAPAYLVVVFTLSVLSLTALPLYGFITWKVSVDDKGLTAFSSFKKQFLPWQECKSLKRRVNFKYPRYVLSGGSSDASFPIWMEHIDQLINLIRERLPDDSEESNPYRQFKQDLAGIILQFVQSGANLGLLALFWFFTLMYTGQGGTVAEAIYLHVFCLILTPVLFWRAYMVALMPFSVNLTPDQLVIKTFLFERSVPWSGVKKVGKSIPILPEGFVVSTEKGSFLIGMSMQESDELERAIGNMVEPPPEPAGTESDIKTD